MLAGQADGLGVDVVDRARELPDLFIGAERQRLDLRYATALAEPFDFLGQRDLCHLQRALAQTSDRPDERAADGEREDQGGQNRTQDDRGVTQGVGSQGIGAMVQRAVEVGGQALRHRAIPLDARPHRLGERGRTHAVVDRPGVGVATNVGFPGQRCALVRGRQPVESIDRGRFCARRVRRLGAHPFQIGEIWRGDQDPLRRQCSLRRESVNELVCDRAHGAVVHRRGGCRDRGDDAGGHVLRPLGDHPLGHRPGFDVVAQRLGGGGCRRQLGRDGRVELGGLDQGVQGLGALVELCERFVDRCTRGGGICQAVDPIDQPHRGDHDHGVVGREVELRCGRQFVVDTDGAERRRQQDRQHQGRRNFPPQRPAFDRRARRPSHGRTRMFSDARIMCIHSRTTLHRAN